MPVAFALALVREVVDRAVVMAVEAGEARARAGGSPRPGVAEMPLADDAAPFVTRPGAASPAGSAPGRQAVGRPRRHHGAHQAEAERPASGQQPARVGEHIGHGRESAEIRDSEPVKVRVWNRFPAVEPDIGVTEVISEKDDDIRLLPLGGLMHLFSNSQMTQPVASRPVVQKGFIRQPSGVSTCSPE